MAIDKLKAIKERAEKAKGFAGDGESPFLQIKEPGAVKIRFLQELTDDSPVYDERRGLVYVYDEHTSPKDFKKAAECTAESEGHCWACEQQSNPEVGKKWKPKMRFIANVVVRGEGDTPDRVKLLKRGFSDKDIGGDLIDYAEEFGSLGGMDIKYKRDGKGMNDTSYSLIPLPPKPLSKDDQALELIDPAKFVKVISYADQAAFYLGESDGDGGSASDWTK
jgi:hypothetical protein